MRKSSAFVRDRAVFALSMLGMVALWAVAAWVAAAPRTLPSPLAVGGTIAGEAETGALWRHKGATGVRVVRAFALTTGPAPSSASCSGWCPG